MKKSFKEHNFLYKSLIITFAILYLSTAFVSWYHAITFFNIANDPWLSIIVSAVCEVGQGSVLFSLMLTKNKHRLLPWFIMTVLTTLQVIGNVVSSYKFIQTSTTMDFQYFQQSILFWVENTDSQMFKVIIAWITGGILPVVALSMTALVAENISLVNEETKSTENIISDEKIQDELITEEEYLIGNINTNIKPEPEVNIDYNFSEIIKEEKVEEKIVEPEIIKEEIIEPEIVEPEKLMKPILDIIATLSDKPEIIKKKVKEKKSVEIKKAKGQA